MASGRYDTFVAKLKAAVFESPGTVSTELRRAIADRQWTSVPLALAPYVEKVALHAYKVTDEDVEAVKRAGYSEDEIFEATSAAAVGAALMRLECGMAVVRASRPQSGSVA
jgi:alkylhydroperoxidase family enzyme